MRVVAGEFRGRRLTAPASPSTRPTTDRVREAIFNALDEPRRVDGALVADLYAGSGALGIEALSRGAEHCTFVESDRHALSAIHDNIATLGLTGRTRVMSGDVLAMVPRIDCDVAFADPPYDFTDWPRLLDRRAGWAARRRSGDRGGSRAALGATTRQALRPHLGHVSRAIRVVVTTSDERHRPPARPPRRSLSIAGRARARAAQPTSPADSQHPREPALGTVQRQRRGVRDRVVGEHGHAGEPEDVAQIDDERRDRSRRPQRVARRAPVTNGDDR